MYGVLNGGHTVLGRRPALINTLSQMQRWRACHSHLLNWSHASTPVNTGGGGGRGYWECYRAGLAVLGDDPRRQPTR